MQQINIKVKLNNDAELEDDDRAALEEAVIVSLSEDAGYDAEDFAGVKIKVKTIEEH